MAMFLYAKKGVIKMARYHLLIHRCIRIAGSIDNLAKYLEIPKVWLNKLLNDDLYDADLDRPTLNSISDMFLEMYDMCIKYGHKTMKRYKYGYYDSALQVGYHDNLGRVYKRIMKGAYGHIYTRFFFDVDKTNGTGICEYNIECWFNRE